MLKIAMPKTPVGTTIGTKMSHLGHCAAFQASSHLIAAAVAAEKMPLRHLTCSFACCSGLGVVTGFSKVLWPLEQPSREIALGHFSLLLQSSQVKSNLCLHFYEIWGKNQRISLMCNEALIFYRNLAIECKL